MQKNNLNNIDDSLLDKIVSVAYGDAGWMDRVIVYKIAKKNPLINQLLNEYKLTADSIHNIKETELPEGIIETVKIKLNNESDSASFGSFIYSWLYARPI